MHTYYPNRRNASFVELADKETNVLKIDLEKTIVYLTRSDVEPDIQAIFDFFDVDFIQFDFNGALSIIEPFKLELIDIYRSFDILEKTNFVDNLRNLYIELCKTVYIGSHAFWARMYSSTEKGRKYTNISYVYDYSNGNRKPVATVVTLQFPEKYAPLYRSSWYSICSTEDQFVKSMGVNQAFENMRNQYRPKTHRKIVTQYGKTVLLIDAINSQSSLHNARLRYNTLMQSEM